MARAHSALGWGRAGARLLASTRPPCRGTRGHTHFPIRVPSNVRLRQSTVMGQGARQGPRNRTAGRSSLLRSASALRSPRAQILNPLGQLPITTGSRLPYNTPSHNPYFPHPFVCNASSAHETCSQHRDGLKGCSQSRSYDMCVPEASVEATEKPAERLAQGH